ncbi:MAG: UDP-2,3-diacylglucosamine diphosphatase LpxI [Pseudomonadota bacterium]
MAGTGGLGLIAGSGALPRLIAEAERAAGRPYRVVRFAGVSLDWVEDHPVIEVPFEKPGRLFEALRAAGCDRVSFAGGMTRPHLDPRRFDLTALRLAPKVLPAIGGGDDALLRTLAAVFEDAGFRVVPPDGLLGDLAVRAGVLSEKQPSDADRDDAARGFEIVAALGRVDVGQGAVVAGGLCLGLETLQGTDALLVFVAETRPEGIAGGVLAKAPKPGQDRRLDMPTIGPATVEAAATAGLSGIAVAAEDILLLDRAETVARANAHGLALWAVELSPSMR